MRRAEPLTATLWEAFDFEAFCNQPDYIVPAERKADGFGRLDGRIVVVDYGN